MLCFFLGGAYIYELATILNDYTKVKLDIWDYTFSRWRASQVIRIEIIMVFARLWLVRAFG